MSLVEHALCPLDAGRSLAGSLQHQSSYWYFDKHRNRKKASAVVKAVDGLSAHDEFYLWGILGLVFSQPDISPNLYATRNYILRRLGIAVGGESYHMLHSSLRRLAGVRYHNDRFWDPLRGEHRQVCFGFLSYSIPVDPNSQRAWHIAIDPIFFELIEPLKAHFWVDLDTYRQLDAASRRLFLLLKKVFHRSGQSPRWDLNHLAVDVLGYSSLERKFLTRKIKACAARLADLGVVDLSRGLLDRRGKNLHVQFHRGGYFDTEPRTPLALPIEELPIYEQWVAIGVDPDGMQYLRRNFSMELLQQWTDITLAANERHGRTFFDRSMAAYYIDNVKAAKRDGRTPPDWWHDFKKQEIYAIATTDASGPGLIREQPSRQEYMQWLRTDGRELYERTLHDLFEPVQVHGRASQSVAASVRQKADTMLWQEFVAETRSPSQKKKSK